MHYYDCRDRKPLDIVNTTDKKCSIPIRESMSSACHDCDIAGGFAVYINLISVICMVPLLLLIGKRTSGMTDSRYVKTMCIVMSFFVISQLVASIGIWAKGCFNNIQGMFAREMETGTFITHIHENGLLPGSGALFAPLACFTAIALIHFVTPVPELYASVWRAKPGAQPNSRS